MYLPNGDSHHCDHGVSATLNGTVIQCIGNQPTIMNSIWQSLLADHVVTRGVSTVASANTTLCDRVYIRKIGADAETWLSTPRVPFHSILPAAAITVERALKHKHAYTTQWTSRPTNTLKYVWIASLFYHTFYYYMGWCHLHTCHPVAILPMCVCKAEVRRWCAVGMCVSQTLTD